MVGRNRELIGVRSKDLRIRFVSSAGHKRGFYARHRRHLGAWECQVSGYGMQPRRWFSPSQTLALCELRFIPALYDWRRVLVDCSAQWDGIADAGYSADPSQCVGLFAGAAA
jgi:hypothetical protein